MNSIWTETINIKDFQALDGDRKTDVLIIGGGIAGMLCARFLHDAGIDYMLVESNKIGSGITKNTTAKITSQHGLMYDKLLKDAGVEKTKMYLRANELAISQFKKLSENFSCDFEEKDAFVYSKDDIRAIEAEITALHKIGYSARFTNSVPLPFDIAGAVRFEKQAQFHPKKFLAGISQDLNIFENTLVKELMPGKAVTNRGVISAEKIIVATHFPFLNKHGAYFLKMYQHRSYAIALENAPNIGGMYLEEKIDGLSFRNYDNLLIIGGGDHKTGKEGGNWKVLRELAEQSYPVAKETYAWAAQDCMTLDGVPYIGKYGGSAKGLYVATGFNKWGMTSSMVAAMILRDTVQGKKNDFAEVFSPQRSMLKPQLLINGFNAVTNLLRFSQKRCPHLGCALRWNSVERTWDCPCHGSRFEEHGELIDNPATGDLKL